jgi:hypothetical protein
MNETWETRESTKLGCSSDLIDRINQACRCIINLETNARKDIPQTTEQHRHVAQDVTIKCKNKRFLPPSVATETPEG